MSLGVPLSDRQVSGFDDAERLLLWALRHRVAEDDPASAHLVRAFAVMCGPTAGPLARQALNRLVDAFEAFARRPLAFLDWCNRAVTEDEAAVLAVCAELQSGRSAGAGFDALVVPAGADTTRAAAAALVGQLAAAGLHLPAPHPTTPRGNHDVADRPFAMH